MPFPVTPSPVVRESVAATQAPFWLRLFGQWVHLQGVVPGTEVEKARASSELETVDGIMWRQQAPRSRRTWSLDLEWAPPEAIRALEVADQTPGDVWLLDRRESVTNMLAPGDCYGAGAPLLADGMPLPRFTSLRTITLPVRAGVETFVSAWTTAATGNVIGVQWPGDVGYSYLTAPGGTVAQRVSTSATPIADGTLSIAALAGSTGLQVTEEWLPESWLPGRRCPTRVAVTGLSSTGRRMSARSQGLSDYSVTLAEVGA